jgi:hypothetical protein
MHVASIAADASLRLARQRRRAHFDALLDWPPGRTIGSWADFYAAFANRPWLARLDDYPDALLVAGCDPAATTALARLFKRLPSFAHPAHQRDDELDGALRLAGLSQQPAAGRHCFDTSHLRERYYEYFTHERFRLLWVIREPRSAVRSLLDARTRLPLHDGTARARRARASRLERACATYLSSIRQTMELKTRLRERIAIVDYDELATHRAKLLPALCRFADIHFDNLLLRHLHGKSVRKGELASWEAMVVDQLTLPAYRRACAASTLGASQG